MVVINRTRKDRYEKAHALYYSLLGSRVADSGTCRDVYWDALPTVSNTDSVTNI